MSGVSPDTEVDRAGRKRAARAGGTHVRRGSLPRPVGNGGESMARQGLTPKQQRFVREYLKDHNATQAAVRAGFSEKNADKIGPRLVGKSRVQKAIRERMEAQAA